MFDVMIRQPIFARDLGTYGYKLLFPQNLPSMQATTDRELAAPTSLSSRFSPLDVETVTNGGQAFITLSHNLLDAEITNAFSAELIRVEVMDDIEATPEVLRTCQHLKQMGFKLVLDDVVYSPQSEILTSLADMIKVNFRTRSLNERIRLPRLLRTSQLTFLAEHVETQADLQVALAGGYDYIHGSFFTKPETISFQNLSTEKSHCLKILSKLSRPQLNFDALEQIILTERSFEDHLLRFVNSSYFNLPHQVNTVRRAMMLLGEEEIRKWVALMILQSLGKDRPGELANLSAIRSKFCELIGTYSGLDSRRTNLYFTGLLSLIDVFTGPPLADVLSQLSLEPEVRQTLQGAEGQGSTIYQLVLAYERADWHEISSHITQLQLDVHILPRLYLQALSWADHTTAFDTFKDSTTQQGTDPQLPVGPPLHTNR